MSDVNELLARFTGPSESGFRRYFEERTGLPWPKVGDVNPYALDGANFDVPLFETIADYLDELTRRVEGPQRVMHDLLRPDAP